MSSRSTDIVFLLGAGASVEAGIPASATMINEIEKLLSANDDWKEFTNLYHHVKSAIYYSAGLKGSFGDDVLFNVETLVNTLYELERNEEHPLYPFIASWNSRFVGLARANFEQVRKFRRLILRELKKWMCPEDTARGDYYRGFISIQRHLNYPLQVFSLNYDLCMERIGGTEFRVEAGFADTGPSHLWDWERFEPLESGPNPLPQVYLYKLHGSINWKRDEGRNLFSVEQTENVDAARMEVIFGRDFKLEAADPYLFYAYQFRRFTLDARLVVIIGYGFADDHINKMLTQALKKEDTRQILVVSHCSAQEQCAEKQSAVAGLLGIKEDQVRVRQGTAKSFFEADDSGKVLVESIPQTKGPF
jgi:SIR2-like protein